MSTVAVDWALKQETGDAGCKLTLVAMAQLADKEQHRCFPGVGHLAKVTEQSIGKVHDDLTVLTQLKLIGDTGLRKGPLRRGILWQLGVTGPAEHREYRL